MASKVFLAVALVALLAGSSRACIVKPGGCAKSVCAKLPVKFPNPSLNYTDPATWKQEAMKGVAFYNGVWNKLAATANAPKANTLDTWKQTRGSDYFVNLEKVPVESGYVLGSPKTGGSLKDCCSDAGSTPGVVMYLYQPASTASGASLTGGTCYFLTGGSYSEDGPFDVATGKNYGSPNSGTKTQQAANKVNKIGYLGGFCNPAITVTDDPHFTGAHGTRFDFNGQLNKPYCLVSDKDIHINAVLKGYSNSNGFHATLGSDGKATRSWIKELGIVWADAAGSKHSLHLTARTGAQQARGEGFLASAQLDGAPLGIPSAAGASVEAGEVAFTFLGVGRKGWYDLDKYNVKVGDKLDLSFDMRVAHPKLQTPDDAEVHFNLMFNDLKVTDKVHGVLGQTYRNTPQQLAKAIKFSQLGRILGSPVAADGASGKGFLEGAVADYVSSSAVATDCKMSVFAA